MGPGERIHQLGRTVMVTARARTDESGRQICSTSHLYQEPLYEDRRDPWSVKVDTEPGHLGDVYGNNKYALLARYLHNERGISLHAKIRYGRKGTIRLIVCCKNQYRSDAYKIFMKIKRVKSD